MKEKKRRKIRLSIPGIILGILLLIMNITLIVFLKLFDIIPDNYYYLIVVVLFIISIIINFFLIFKFKNKALKVFKIIFMIISTILIVAYSFGTYYLNKTMNLFDNISVIKEEITKYYIVVLDTSIYQEPSDLYEKSLAYYENTDSEVINSLKLSLKYEVVKDMTKLKEKLYNHEVESILISDIIKNKYEEDDETFTNNIRILKTIEIKKSIEDITKKVSIKNTPFNILISGIDTYGKVTSVSRSDVNILVTVNPKTNKIYMVHVPRDYYVTLAGKNAKDKLTHSGIYGIDCSVKTLENLFDTEINYYVRLNFTSLINVVNAIGGVDVVSKYSFDTGIYDEHMTETYHFNKGKNHLNGSQALSFVRERHAFNDGDRVRGENQMLVLSAIINKVISPSILNNYTKLLNSLSNAFVTNLTEEELTKLVRKQLDNNKSWSIEQTELNGTAAYQYTFSYPRQKLYTMVPDEELIKNAKEKIDEVINEK